MKSFLAMLVMLGLAALSGCRWDGGPGALEAGAYEGLSRCKGIHPRLLLTAGEEERLRGELYDGRRWLWERYLQDLPATVSAASGRLPETLDRHHGDLAANLAFAWRATDADSLYGSARDYLEALCAHGSWDPEYSLVHGHLLLGAALAYDWLYPRLDRVQRRLIADRIGDEAEAHYRDIVDHRAWYRFQYQQNHAHVSFAALAYAGVALYGEDARAQDWLAASLSFYRQAFAANPPDGGSVEGLSYGNYAMEYALRFAELARRNLGIDCYASSPWLREYPRYVLHSLLPSSRPDRWAMTFGDSPRHGNYHGPEPQLFLLASRYGDPQAQWLGRWLILLEPRGLGSASWWAVLWHDTAVEPARPDGFPTLWHLADLGQVMLRSSWEDTAATMIGFKCGPFLGKAQADSAAFDLGSAHGHPDAGSLQIFHRGEFLSIDPGYTYFKRTADHSTLLVKGHGQLGEDEPWFAAGEALHYRHHPEILETRSDSGYHYVKADLAPAYHPHLGLRKLLRHLVFLPPDLLLVADEIELDEQGVLYSWPADSLETEEGLRHEGGYVVGETGRAGVSFPGESGQYTVAVSYLDNAPGSGSYCLMVDSARVYAWQDTMQATDTHYEVASGIRLHSGSRLRVVGEPLGRGARLVKLVVSSPTRRAPRELTWLLQFDPETRIERNGPRIEATLGELVLELHPLAPAQRSHDWGDWNVTGGTEFRQTRVLAIRPAFEGDNILLMSLIHLRDSRSPGLSPWVDFEGGRCQVRWSERGQPCSLSFDPKSGEVRFQR